MLDCAFMHSTQSVLMDEAGDIIDKLSSRSQRPGT
jgi:hypothetical protein